MNPSVDKEAVSHKAEDLKATFKIKQAAEAIAKTLQETLPYRYNPDIRYKAGPLTPFNLNKTANPGNKQTKGFLFGAIY